MRTAASAVEPETDEALLCVSGESVDELPEASDDEFDVAEEERPEISLDTEPEEPKEPEERKRRCLEARLFEGGAVERLSRRREPR